VQSGGIFPIRVEQSQSNLFHGRLKRGWGKCPLFEGKGRNSESVAAINVRRVKKQPHMSSRPVVSPRAYRRQMSLQAPVNIWFPGYGLLDSF